MSDTPRYQQRMQDYVLGPRQDPRLASVGPGVGFETELALDPDAPFLLRGLAERCAYVFDAAPLQNPITQRGLQFLSRRFTGPAQNYLADAPVNISLDGAFFGQWGNPKPVVPEEYYPASSTIYVQLLNSGPDTLTNLTFYFRGVKLYPWGSNQIWSYPDRFSPSTFVLPYTVANLGVTESRFDQVIQGPNDADVVLRTLQAGFAYPNQIEIPGYSGAYEVFVRFKDEELKPYSNDWVALDVISGYTTQDFGFTPCFQTGPSTFMYPLGTGNSNPGLFFPELYLPRQHLLYLDIMRDDSAAAAASTPGITVAHDIPFLFRGSRVFPR